VRSTTCSAYNEVLAEAGDRHPLQLSVQTLEPLNRVILDGLNVAPEVVPGMIRTHSVAVGSYVGAPAEDCAYLLDQLTSWLNEMEPSDPSEVVPFAFIKAVVAHVYLEWIHPFGDGNGRLGRLAEFIILTNSGIATPAAHVLTSHYNDTRSEYYRQLQQASRNGGDLTPFLLYAAQGFVDGLLTQIKLLHKQQEKLMWRHFVDQRHEGKPAETASRQPKLALSLGAHDGWIERDEISLLDRSLARAYSNRTDKTVTRDLNKLAECGYVEIKGSRVRARTELIGGMRAFTAEQAS